jgi:hypothetical protein
MNRSLDQTHAWFIFIFFAEMHRAASWSESILLLRMHTNKASYLNKKTQCNMIEASKHTIKTEGVCLRRRTTVSNIEKNIRFSQCTFSKQYNLLKHRSSRHASTDARASRYKACPCMLAHTISCHACDKHARAVN